jgi:hypothetical protein
MNDLYWLTDKQMTRLRPYSFKSHGMPWVDDLRVLGGIDLVNLTGLRWCDETRTRSRRKTLDNRRRQSDERNVLLRTMEGAFGSRAYKEDRHNRRDAPEGATSGSSRRQAVYV